jgi:hypothetical protein
VLPPGAPAITVQPISGATDEFSASGANIGSVWRIYQVEGSTVTLAAAAAGTNNSYQWYFAPSNTTPYNGFGAFPSGMNSPIPGATEDTLIINNLSAAADGYYTLTVTNAFGSASTNPVGVGATTTATSTFTTVPDSTDATVGDTAILTAAATGSPFVTYQWSYSPDGTTYAAIAGETGPTLTVLASSLTYSPPANPPATPTPTPSPQPPEITTQPQNQTANEDADVTFWVAATGYPTPSYQWYINGTPISGATSPSYTATAIPATVGTYTVILSNQGGMVTSDAVTLAINLSSITPPSGGGTQGTTTVATGGTAVLSANSSGGGALTASSPSHGAAPTSRVVGIGGSPAQEAVSGVTYQWFWNGSPIAGATGSTYVLSDVSAANDGIYTCLETNAGGSVMTSPATIAVVDTQDPGRLINLSTRAQVGTGQGIALSGFVVGGSGTFGLQNVLIRASGPALTQFGVSGVLPDPQVQLNSPIYGDFDLNTGWAGDPTIGSTAASVGAFTWPNPSSLDAALDEILSPGLYTAEVSGASGDTGVSLTEIYDATPAGTYTLSTPRLVNISTRAQVGTGGNVMIAGFVIGGTTSKTVLIRASGPALAAFGVSGTLPDPLLQLSQSKADGTSTPIQSDAGWGGDTQIAATAASVGAFSWGISATPDSAIFVTLPPGSYTAEVSGASGDTGLALIEVYDVQ